LGLRLHPDQSNAQEERAKAGGGRDIARLEAASASQPTSTQRSGPCAARLKAPELGAGCRLGTVVIV
jgi:hypothetical protein